MAEYKLALEKRELTGKKLKKVRAEGLIPAVIYGGKEPVMVTSEYVATEKVLEKAGYHSPIDLDIVGKKQLAIVKNVQIDPVSRRILNVEFQAISAKEVVEATAPIVVVNFEASEAAKTYHFAMTQSLEEIAVKAKPADLPKELTIDASKMETVEDKLTLGEIELPTGVEFADKELDLEQVIVSLYDPAAEAEKREAETAEAEATEVEVTETPAEEAKTEE
jgi:large subunit ribosomal protein L25